MRIFILCMCSLLLTACGSDDSNNAVKQSELSRAGLDVGDINADTPPTNGTLPADLAQPAE